MGERRLGRDHYYLGLAQVAALRANCVGLKVGAVAVRGDRVVATGYNGTPSGFPNCLDGGCVRCAHRDRYPSGTAYDRCICVHAEGNILATAARFGIPLDGATLYATHQPCYSCGKELAQAGFAGVVYVHPWTPPDAEVARNYEELHAHLNSRRVAMPSIVDAAVVDGLRADGPA